jgi:AIPR protein
MSDLSGYFQELMADVRYDADVSGIMTVEAFFERVKDRLTEAGELETADRAFFQSGEGGQRLRIDGCGGDPRDAQGVLSLIVCDFQETEAVQTFNKEELPKLFNPLVRYLQNARTTEFRDGLNEISPGFQVSDLIISTWSQVSKIKLIVVSNRAYNGRSDADSAGVLDGIPVTRNVWDLARLEKWDSTGQASEDRTIDFAGEFGGALPALKASRASEKLESYLAVIPGPQLAAIYDKWGARLLEANVRSFLQARAATNKGIARTIRDTPDLFFSYNNGISATADSVDVAEGPDGLRITTITNLQIVNGGQTTGSVHAALKTSKENLKDVFIQMKLTVVPRDQSEVIVPKISEYANTQNKVNAADFFSNHPFHVRMQDFSRRVIAPKAEGSRFETKWFYERARGQYLDERTKRTEAQRKKFELENPKSQLFSKTDLAKFEHSAAGQPHVVSTGAQKNFAAFAKATGEAWEKSDAKFDETWYKRLIAKAIMFKALETAVPKQQWYEGGYRANIVTYSMAKVFHDASASDRQVLDLDMVWRRQTVPEPLMRALLIAAATSAQVIVSPPSGVRNMSEWAKKQACWAEVKGTTLIYDDDFDSCLIEPDQARAEVRHARADRTMVSGIEAQIKVTTAGAAFWADLLLWGRANRKLSEREAKTLEICSSYPKKIPTEFQCQQAVSVLERLTEEGFVERSA